MHENPYKSPEASISREATDHTLRRRRIARISLIALGTGLAGLTFIFFFLFPILGMVLGFLSLACFRTVKRINPAPESTGEY